MKSFLLLPIIYTAVLLIPVAIYFLIIKTLSFLKININKKVQFAVIIFTITIFSTFLILAVNPSGTGGNYPRDYGIAVTMLKTSSSIDNYVDSKKLVPTDNELLPILNNVEKRKDCDDNDYICLFSIIGNSLTDIEKESCDLSNWRGEGSNECYYRYEGFVKDNNYKIWARRYGEELLFMYDSRDGKLYQCDINEIGYCGEDNYLPEWILNYK